MDIRVSGHQVDTGSALQDHAETRLNGIVEKYFPRALSTTVTVSPAPQNAFRCDIVMHVMQGLILKGHGVAGDAYVALNQASEKIDKQLRRYKRRLTDRHAQAEQTAREEDAAYVVFDGGGGGGDEEEDVADAPVIVAETTVDVPEVSVADAVMMLDLRNTNALLFKNAGTARHNMVYRRDDGSIGWVEPR
jgi:ribosomal subunit interface protein